jgi:hypothetical protein
MVWSDIAGLPIDRHVSDSKCGSERRKHSVPIEVTLTPESVEALQFLPQASTNVETMSDELMLQYGLDELIGINVLFRAHPVYYLTQTQALSPSETSGADPWFLGGLDPLSAMPTIIGGPIRMGWLISHCSKIQP